MHLFIHNFLSSFANLEGGGKPCNPIWHEKKLLDNEL